MSNFRKFISMAAIAMLGVTNVLTPLSYASAENMGNYDNITFPVTAKSFSFIMPAHNVYLYAVTEANKYFVRYNGNEHTSGEMEDDTFTYDTTGYLAPNAFVKTGYTWKSWNELANGGGTSYESGATVWNWTGVESGTIDIYAQWDANRYRIKYVMNDNDGGTSSGVHTGQPDSGAYDQELTINPASRTGYIFSGWHIENMDSEAHEISGVETHDTERDYEKATSYVNLRADDGEVTFGARWDPRPDTYYEVRHFLQKLDGSYGTGNEYEEHDEETGTTDTKVTPGVKTYTGYSNSGVAYEDNINADGSTVFYYHYPRQTHTLTLRAGRGIDKVQGVGTVNTTGGTANTGGSVDISFLYEEPVTLTYVVSAGYTGATWSGYLDESGSFLMPETNEEKTAYAEPIVYHITYQTYSGTVSPENTGEYTIETNSFILNEPTRDHSRFIGWTGSNGDEPNKTIEIEKGSMGDRQYYANYVCYSGYHSTIDYMECIPDEDTEYIVNHWRQDFDGSYPDNELKYEQTLTGKTDTSTQAVEQHYEGFTVDPSRQQGNISGDVTTVINIYYTRNTNTITMNDITGTTEGFSALHSSVGGPYKYGDTITLTHDEDDGYTWDGWTVTYTSGGDTINVDLNGGNTFSMPDGPVTITPHVTIDPYTITMYPHGGTLTGGNTTGYNVETPTFNLPEPTRDNSIFLGWKGTGDTTTPVNAEKPLTITKGSTGDRSYEAVWGCETGYTLIGDACVANIYTVSINYKDEGNDEGDRIVTGTFTYDDPNPTPIPNPTQSGYTFAGWTVEGYNSGTATVDGNPLVSPTSGTVFRNLTPTSGATVTLVANWIANSDTVYTVYRYTKVLSGDTYEFTGVVETHTGTTDEAVNINKIKGAYSGFTYTGFKAYTVAPEHPESPSGERDDTVKIDKHGDTKIYLYYDRDNYHVYLSGDEHVDSAGFVGEGDYEYGAEVTVDMEAKTGYHFVRWERRKADRSEEE